MTTRRRPLSRPVVAAGAVLLALAPSAASRAAGAARFTITDQLAAQEVSEKTEIYLDGKLLAAVRLGGGRTSRTIDASVEDGGAPHSYALCGEITVRRADGTTETHEVNASGTISDVDGRAFQALGAADFTFFYLADPTPGRALSQPSRARSPLCHPPLS